MTKKVMLAVAVMAVSGCQTQFTKDGVSATQANTDTQECRREASLATASLADPVSRIARMHDMTADCLRMRGYR